MFSPRSWCVSLSVARMLRAEATRFALGQRNQLRARGRARRMENQRDVRRGCISARDVFGGRGRRGRERERPRSSLGLRLELHHRDAEPGCDFPGRRLAASLHDEGPAAQIRQIELELLGPVGRVQRRRRGRGGDADKGRGHLGTVRQDDGDPIVPAHAYLVERADRAIHLPSQLRVGQRTSPWRSDRRRLGFAPGNESFQREISGHGFPRRLVGHGLHHRRPGSLAYIIRSSRSAADRSIRSGSSPAGWHTRGSHSHGAWESR